MSIGALIAKPLFNDFIPKGIAAPDAELRVNLLERWNANTAWASEINIEYAVWAFPGIQLGGIGDPPIQGNAESTDGSGEIVINVAGTFNVGDNVLVAIRKPLAGPSSETVYALGEETITEA